MEGSTGGRPFFGFMVGRKKISSIREIRINGLFTFILILIYFHSANNDFNMKKLLLFVFLSVSTLIASSQIDTIIVTPSSPIPSQDSLGYNAKVVVQQSFDFSSGYYCQMIPLISLNSNIAPLAIAVVYDDDSQYLWLKTEFLFYLAPNDTLTYCAGFEDPCWSPIACNFSQLDDLDFDGLACDSLWSDGEVIPLISNDHYIDCHNGISEASSSELRVYPNLASDRIKISSPFSSGSSRVFSNTGSLALNRNFYTSNFDLDINTLDIGLYMIELADSDGHKVIGRFVKN